MTSEQQEKLNQLLYCVDGMKEEFVNNDLGAANNWMRHVVAAYQEYEESLDDTSNFPPK